MDKRNHKEIRVRNVSVKVNEDLSNIAKNLGVALSDFLKPKLREIADSYPASMKLPPAED
jgi:hypothetical protein